MLPGEEVAAKGPIVGVVKTISLDVVVFFRNKNIVMPTMKRETTIVEIRSGIYLWEAGIGEVYGPAVVSNGTFS